MDRLSSLDESFLDLDRSGPSLAVGTVVGIEGKAPTLAKLRAFFASRLPSVPNFMQKFEPSRTKFMRGKWVDATPDLTQHVKQRRIKPGGSIDAVVSKIIEVPMDLDLPLWDVTMITGYATNEWTLVIRLHHAIADGQGATVLLGQLIDLDAEGNVRLTDAIRAMVAPRSVKAGHGDGGLFETTAGKLINATEKSMRLAGLFISTLPDTVRSMLMFLPQERLNSLTGDVSDKRIWASGRFPLAEVKAAKRSLKKVTINDIVMAAVAVGFTDLLLARGEDPEGRTLRTVMPTSLRRDLKTNNQVGLLPLPVPLGDVPPKERLREIKQETKYSKKSTLPVIGDQLRRSTEKLIPAPVEEVVVELFAANTEYLADTLVTNVPGPQFPMYFMGEEIVSSMPIIPIEAQFRIIVGVTSFGDYLNIGVTGDGENATDIDVLVAGIKRGLAEIVEYAANEKVGSKQKHSAAAQAQAEKRRARES